jgi:hypothetical protein
LFKHRASIKSNEYIDTKHATVGAYLKSILLLLVLLVIDVFVGDANIFAQADSNPVSIEFIRDSDSITDGAVHFNVLRIKNNTGEQIQGETNFSTPQGWPLIADANQTISLNPGEEFLLPVRLSVPANIVGGISYIFSGIFKTSDEYIYANSYIYVISESRWNLELDKNTIYINEFKGREQFGIKVANLGNKKELIRLKFNIGHLIDVVELDPADSIVYVNVNPYSDTVFLYSVEENKNINYAQKQSSKNNWKASTVLLEASTTEKKVSTSLRVRQLVSCEKEITRKQVSPLNYEFVLFNLMSNLQLKMNHKAHGVVLLKDRKSIGYSFNINNVYFDADRNQDFSFDRNARFLIGYHSDNVDAFVGDNIGAGSVHTINGRGAEINVRVNKNTIKATAVQNPISKYRGAHLNYSRPIKNVSTTIGLTYDDNPERNDYSAYSFSSGIGFRFLKTNTLNAELVVSNSNYLDFQQQEQDTSLLGFGYRIYFKHDSKKFRLQLSNLNSKHNYLRNSGVMRSYLTSHYLINSKMRLYVFYERNDYTATKYPYNLFNPPNLNLNDHGRILYSYNKGNTMYQIGPQYIAATRKFHDVYSGFFNEYKDYSPGLYGSVTYRISNLRSISPNATVSNLNFNYTTNDTLFNNYSITNEWYYSFGVNYYDYVWRLNIFYTSGATSNLYRSVLTEEDPSVSQAFHIRPYYERYFKDNTVRLSGYLNYSYYTPSGRENFVLNLSSDYFLKNYWQLYFSFNVFSNARVDDELGRISNRNFNTIIGVRKSFDIQQPRLKYHDVTINCFNDINGNLVRDAQEKPISNVLIKITRNIADSIQSPVSFPQTELLTNAEGQICYENMPEGTYVLELSPLFNLENMFFLDGQKQILIVDSKKEFQLPLVESYKVKGEIQIDRDPNSTEGRISLEGIRITALSEDGYSYSVLTDRFGGYIINLPHDKTYTITMSNVFNKNFSIEQQKYIIRFGSSRSIKIDFKVHEKKREIRFEEGEQFFEFNKNNLGN